MALYACNSCGKWHTMTLWEQHDLDKRGIYPKCECGGRFTLRRQRPYGR